MEVQGYVYDAKVRLAELARSVWGDGALGDFAVTYELNVYCSDVPKIMQLYSALHRSILEVFNEYGVQIMTPAYEGDPDQPKVVPRDKWHEPPALPPKAP